MARTGRPRLEIPRNQGVFIRLTKDEYTALIEYARNHNQTITQTLVQGFKILQEQENTKNE